MVTTPSQLRSRSTSPPPPPSFAMRNPQEEGRAPTRARSSSCPQTETDKAAIEDDSISKDIHLEILSRVPAKSLCHFKCASKRWLSFVDNPEHRSSLPQSLAGFFYNSTGSDERSPGSALHFVNASGRGAPFIDPSFAFLGGRRFHLLDCCNGLVLCLRYDDDEFRTSRYVVCNPATKKWVVLPDRNLQPSITVGTARLGFDPAASPHHFHVFLVSLDATRLITGVEIYSSETQRWIYKDRTGRKGGLMLQCHRSATVFHNGSLYLQTYWHRIDPRICAVNTNGQEWRNLPKFCIEDIRVLDSIHQSQGGLYYASFKNVVVDDDDDDDDGRRRWELEVHAFEEEQYWALEHSVEASEVDGLGDFEASVVDRLGDFDMTFDWIAMHPESKLIFFTQGSDNTLKCYSMNRRHVTALRTLGEGGQPPYLPYVPLYSQLESLPN